ncbi:MAG: AsmA family protein, partial [Betaproteobacteria bacterium]
MRFKRVTWFSGILLFAAIAAVVIVVKRLDPGALAASLAAAVKSGTGREFTVGAAHIKLLPRPMIVLTDVRFANADWGTRPWLAEAGRVAAAIDLKRLLIGTIRIKYIEVEAATVLLETNRDGVGNWTISRPDAGPPPSLDALEIDRFAVDALAFTYRDGVSGDEKQVKLDAVRFDAISDSNVITLTVHANYDGVPIAAAGKIGTLAALVANQRDYPLDVEGEFGTAALRVHGTIGEPHELRGLNLTVSAQMPEFADYIAQTGAKVPPVGPFRGATQLTGTWAAPVFSAIDMEVGDEKRMKLAIRGGLEGTRKAGVYEWQSSELDLVLTGSELGELSQWYGRPLPAWGAYRVSAKLRGASTTPGLYAIDAVFGGADRPEIKLRGDIKNARNASGVDLQVSASAGKWWRSVLFPAAPPLPPFRASARVRDTRNGYRVDNLDMKIADSIVTASLDVIASGPRPRIAGRVTSPLIDLSRLAPPANTSNQAPAAPPSPGVP